MLLMALTLPIFLTLLFRYLLPWAADMVFLRWQLDISTHYPFFTGVMVMVAPQMLGMLSGFMLLEERDENLPVYYAVTPLGKEGWLLWRMTLPVLLTFLLTLVFMAGVAIIPVNLSVLPVVGLAALQAPFLALIAAAFAGNKVEGMALSKALSLIMLAPVAGYVLAWPWWLPASIIPTFWLPRALLAASALEYWLSLAGGTVTLALWTWLIYRRFKLRYN